jgi:FkbM family methyltransferase
VAESDLHEDEPVEHFSRKSRLIAWISTNLFDGITYTVQNGLLKGMKRKGGLAWLPARFSQGTVTAEHKFWNDLDLNGMTVYDVGAYHGLLTLFFASRAKQVVSFEPNSGNRQRLAENLKLNDIRNVQVRDVGIGSRTEARTMVSDPLFMGGNRVEAPTAAAKSGAAQTIVENVSIVTLDEEIPRSGLPKPDFIKIDKEGWELEALQGAPDTLAQHQPTLFLEMHGDTIREKKRKVAEIVNFLWENGYRNIRHIETDSSITPDNTSIAMQGHLYCKKQ